jgi:DNA topoisomerase I
LRKMGPADRAEQCRKNIVAAIKTASQHLGNTPTVCRKSYIHPVIIEAYLEGSLIPTAERLICKMKSTHAIHLRMDELVLLEFLTLAGK